MWTLRVIQFWSNNSISASVAVNNSQIRARVQLPRGILKPYIVEGDCAKVDIVCLLSQYVLSRSYDKTFKKSVIFQKFAHTG